MFFTQRSSLFTCLASLKKHGETASLLASFPTTPGPSPPSASVFSLLYYSPPLFPPSLLFVSPLRIGLLSIVSNQTFTKIFLCYAPPASAFTSFPPLLFLLATSLYRLSTRAATLPLSKSLLFSLSTLPPMPSVPKLASILLFLLLRIVLMVKLGSHGLLPLFGIPSLTTSNLPLLMHLFALYSKLISTSFSMNQFNVNSDCKTYYAFLVYCV